MRGFQTLQSGRNVQWEKHEERVAEILRCLLAHVYDGRIGSIRNEQCSVRGISTMVWMAKARVEANFEFIDKLGFDYFAFHDVDIAPEGKPKRIWR